MTLADTSVTQHTPTTFLYSTSDDELVPVQASVEFYSALLEAGVPVELHLFRHGAYGSGLGKGDAALAMWPTLLETWLGAQGRLNFLRWNGKRDKSSNFVLARSWWHIKVQLGSS